MTYFRYTGIGLVHLAGCLRSKLKKEYTLREVIRKTFKKLNAPSAVKIESVTRTAYIAQAPCSTAPVYIQAIVLVMKSAHP